MKIRSYVGIDEDVITIEKKEDLYPLLDWFQTKIINLGGSDDDLQDIQKVIELAEELNLGSIDDIDNIEYS